MNLIEENKEIVADSTAADYQMIDKREFMKKVFGSQWKELI
jgi:hypothetical protein